MITMNKSKLALLILSPFVLTSCVVNNDFSSIKAPSIPDSVDISAINNRSKPSESNSGFNEQELSYDHLILEDITDKYFVGETFDSVFRVKLTLIYNKEATEISKRYSSYDFIGKDSSGKEFDLTKPFTKAGKYKISSYMVKDESIKSNEIEINVVDGPTKELKSKTEMPDGMNLQKLEHSCGNNFCIPTLGEQNVLVVPCELSDYPFSSGPYGNNYMQKITTLFNGDGAKDTGYWESVSSYYKKVSHDKLNFKFEIADVYNTGYSTDDYLSNGNGLTVNTGVGALRDYVEKHGANSTQKFDNDKDGYVDGLWMIYSAPNYSTGAYGANPGADVFWAFCMPYSGMNANLETPALHNFGWSSIDFLYNSTDANRIDPHIILHETGHLLSLPDYYSYDIGGSTALGAQGGLTMMDYNIGSHDSFSKLALGWASPYVVTDDCIVKIKPNESSGDCIILADNWNGTPFDEYILLDLQTPTGVNELDATVKYDRRPLYFSIPGIRAYHIDARLGEFKYYSPADGGTKTGVNPVYDADRKDYYLTDEQVKNVVQKKLFNNDISLDDSTPFSSRESGYTVINANSTTRTLISEYPYNNNRLITLVGANNLHPEQDDCVGSNESLFVKGSSWTTTPKTLKYFTSADGIFDNEDNFSFVFTVLEANNDGATIQFRRINDDL